MTHEDRRLVRESSQATRSPVIDAGDLPRTAHAHEFVGADHGDVPFSIILVDAPPGAGPALHRHRYAEVFVIEEGEARFEVGDATFVAGAGQIVVGEPNVPHGFRNDGTGRLRVTAIHGAGRFETEWLAGADPVWASKPGHQGAASSRETFAEIGRERASSRARLREPRARAVRDRRPRHSPRGTLPVPPIASIFVDPDLSNRRRPNDEHRRAAARRNRSRGRRAPQAQRRQRRRRVCGAL